MQIKYEIGPEHLLSKIERAHQTLRQSCSTFASATSEQYCSNYNQVLCCMDGLRILILLRFRLKVVVISSFLPLLFDSLNYCRPITKLKIKNRNS